MITLEVDGIRVEAETEKEARKELRRLVKAAKTAQAEREASYVRAKLKACETAYYALLKIARCEGQPSARELFRPGSQYFEACKPRSDLRHHDGVCYEHEIETGGGPLVRWNHYGYELVGVVCNGGGWLAFAFLKDCSRPDVVTCYAIGTDGEQVALAEVPGLDMAHFEA